MNETRYTLSLINLDLTANKMLFRLKKSDSEQQKDGLKQIICDLDQVKETLKLLKAENEILTHKLFKMHENNLELNELKKILE